MKKISTLILICFALSAKADYWTQKANFPGAIRDWPFFFTIGSKGYVGTGQDTNSNVSTEFWEYDPAANSWTQKANFAGTPRWGAMGFSVGNKGYAGLGGTVGNVTLYQDFWEYDPAANSWTIKAPFPGGAISFAVGFTIGNMGYAGTGYFSPGNQLWRYDPAINSWTQMANIIGGPATGGGVAFVVGTNAYITKNCYDNFLFEYNSISNSWTQKANLPAVGRCNGSAFTICNFGYYGTGELVANNYAKDWWEYNAQLNGWIQKTDFPAAGRDESAAFSIGNKGYFGLGGHDFYGTGIAYDDWWEYTPDSVCPTTGMDEITNYNVQFTISPNPAKDFININIPFAGKEKINLTITDVQGAIVESDNYPSLRDEIKINVSNFSNGNYFVQIENGKEKAVRRFLKE